MKKKIEYFSLVYEKFHHSPAVFVVAAHGCAGVSASISYDNEVDLFAGEIKYNFWTEKCRVYFRTNLIDIPMLDKSNRALYELCEFVTTSNETLGNLVNKLLGLLTDYYDPH